MVPQSSTTTKRLSFSIQFEIDLDDGCMDSIGVAPVRRTIDKRKNRNQLRFHAGWRFSIFPLRPTRESADGD